MKKLITLTMCFLWWAQICLAGDTVTMRVSVVIPELPQTIQIKENAKETITAESQKQNMITVTTTTTRNNQKVILNTVVAR